MKKVFLPRLLLVAAIGIVATDSSLAADYYWGSNNTGTQTPTGATTTATLGGNRWTLNNYNGTVTGNSYVTSATAFAGSNNLNFGGTAGTVQVDRTLGSSTVGDLAVLTSNYVFSLTGANQTVQVSSFSGSGLSSATFMPDSSNRTLTITANTGGTANFTGNLTNNGSSVLTVVISGAVVQLTGANNSYNGTTTVSSSSQLDVSSLADGGSNSSIGKSTNAAANLVFGSSTLNYIGSTNSNTDRLFTIAGGTGTSATILNNGGGVLKFTNTGALAFPTADTTKVVNLGGSNTGDNTLAIALANNGAGALAVNKNNAGTWILSGNNSYTGVTQINAGTLQFAKTASLYSGNSTNWTNFSIRVGGNGTLALNVGGSGEFSTGNVTTLLANLGGASGQTSRGFAANSAIGFDTTNASGGIFTVSNNITNSSGTGGGAIGVTKLGTNTLALSGTNSYTGTTTVNAGTLLVSGGGLAGTSGLAVNGGTLQLGASNVLNDVALTLSSGTFSTGATTGFNETLGTLDLNTGAVLTLALGTGVHSLNFANSSAVDWTGSTLTITGWTGAAGASGTAGKIFFGSNASGLTSLQLSQINFTGFSSGASILNTGEIVAVPEPSTSVMLLIPALIGLLMVWRRRAQS